MPSPYMELPAAAELPQPLELKRREEFPAAAVGQELAECGAQGEPAAASVPAQPGRGCGVGGHFFLHSAGWQCVLSPMQCPVQPWQWCWLLHSHWQDQAAGRRAGLALQAVPRAPSVFPERSGTATRCCLPGENPRGAGCACPAMVLEALLPFVTTLLSPAARLWAHAMDWTPLPWSPLGRRAVMQRSGRQQVHRVGASTRPPMARSWLLWALAHLTVPSGSSSRCWAPQEQRFTAAPVLLL